MSAATVAGVPEPRASRDLDRPARGFITIMGRPLVEVKELMDQPFTFRGP